jgi:thymidylate synthase
MINIDDEYKGLLSSVLHGGADKADRTGTGTKAVFGRMLRHDMATGFPILTTKKIYFEKAVTELLWILSGYTDLAYLNEHGVNYWNADYKRSGRTDGTLGPVYGKQWRDFNGVDQLRKLLLEIQANPNSRRLMVSAWNPAELDDMVLPPCHYGFQVYINNGKIDLMWQQRSADVFLGLPYDFVMYGLLLELIAKGNNLEPGRLIASLGDCHLYNNHLEQARLQLERESKPLPTIDLDFGLKIEEGAGSFLLIPSKNMIKLNNYEHHEAIRAPLSVGG